MARSSLTMAAMEELIQDVRYSFRTLAKAPGFTLTVLATIAVAIGANATVFSFINALLFSPPRGVSSPATLVSVYTSDFSSGRFGSTSYPDFESIRQTGLFTQLAAYRAGTPTLVRVGDETQRVRTVAVSSEFFDLVGLRPLSGRAIGVHDTADGAAPVAVIGELLWQRIFEANPAAVGSTIAIDGVTHDIVGVMPGTFIGLDLASPTEIWTPLHRTPGPNARDSRDLSIVGRLAGDVDLEQAQARLDGLASQLAAAYPDTNKGTLGHPDLPRPFSVLLHTRMPPAFRAQVGMIGAVLLGAVLLVLLIACANIAGLLLSRATARQRELAVRLALGAGRGRVMRQVVTESLLLGTCGGALGLLVALWTSDVLPSFFPAEQVRVLDARVDWRVLGFTAMISLASGLVFGMAPAFRGLRTAPAQVLRGGMQRSSGTTRGRKILVTMQIALAAILLVSSVLLTRSLSNAFQADLGFTTREAVLSSIELPQMLAGDPARTYFDSVLEQVHAIPGVEHAGLAQFVPVASVARRGFTMEGYTPQPGEGRELHFNVVGHTYFETMGMTPVSGRLFTQADRTGRPVAVVNHVLAQRYFAGAAVNRRIRDSHGRDLDIVGVVRADRRLDLQDPSLPVVFYLLDQQPVSRLIVVARTAGHAGHLADTVRRTIAGVNRDVAVFRTVTLEQHEEEALSANRVTVALVTACGGMALALALVGLYGVVSFTVVDRTREIGVRVALGATPQQVLRLLLAENGRVVAFGLVTGMAGAVGAAMLLGSFLYEISPLHPWPYALVLSTVSLIALAASVLPAARALRVNPVHALRHD